MAKKTRIAGYSVIAFVTVREQHGGRWYPQRSPEQAQREADAIKAAIVRHLSHDHPDVARNSIDIEEQSTSFCEHCNGMWSEKSDTYNGGCCDKDEEANPLAVAAE